MNIRGIEGMTGQQVVEEVRRGGRFVIFKYCISVVFLTFLQPTDVFFLRAGQDPGRFSMRYSLLSVLFGWWGIPFGPIYTFRALGTNAKGGEDVTEATLVFLEGEAGTRKRRREALRARAEKRGRRRRKGQPD